MTNTEALEGLNKYCLEKLGDSRWNFYKEGMFTRILNAVDENSPVCDNKPDYWYQQGKELIDTYLEKK